MKALAQHRFFLPAAGAVLTAICGLILWGTLLGDRWLDASYDYLFRFGARAVTNKITVILMDDDSFKELNPGQPWDRALHADLLNKLADDGCPLVVLDIFFERTNEPAADNELAAALRRQKAVVLMAEQTSTTHAGQISTSPSKPAALFLEAATNWGAAYLNTNSDGIVRRHWPFPSPGGYESLAWAAARVAGAKLSQVPQERWLRYYQAHWGLSYHLALKQPTNYFHDKIVFIGDNRTDRFDTPSTQWTHEQSGGVELNAVTFLNLLNGDWLRRLNWPVEALLTLASGIMFGGALCRVRLRTAFAISLIAAVAIMVGGLRLSYFGNYWFPWMLIAGGTIPCALGWALVANRIQRQANISSGMAESAVPVRVAGAAANQATIRVSKAEVLAADSMAHPQERNALAVHQPRFSGWDTVLSAAQGHDFLETPDYEVFDPPFGEGAFGKVWVVRNAIGQWQALKAVYQSRFGKRTGPYEAEFKGIKRYKPVSDKHPGLLRVDFVSKKKAEGYFYYVMELGDAHEPGWEENPARYKPRDLASVAARQPEGRLSPVECVRIALVLAEALDFLHRQALTHRDIKPSNIIFVNGRPKLTDVGLVTDLRPPDEVTSWAGSPGYMPPAPEPTGTAEADIYSLGMVLYVISTGRAPAPFKALSTSLLEGSHRADLLKLNALVLKACEPDCARRYRSAAELRTDLQQLMSALGETVESGA